MDKSEAVLLTRDPRLRLWTRRVLSELSSILDLQEVTSLLRIHSEGECCVVTRELIGDATGNKNLKYFIIC